MCVFVCIISLVLVFGSERVQHSRWGCVCAVFEIVIVRVCVCVSSGHRVYVYV